MIVTDENINAILATHKIVVIDFWADWCRPCKMFSPILDEISEENSIWMGKLNVDENPQSALDHIIHSLPTTIVFKDGLQVKKIIGAKPKHTMLEELAEWL
jgi:thioredoxin 1